MGLSLHFNQKIKEVKPGQSLFEYAENLGIQVPTSCRKQGKCKECLVEVEKGMEHLSSPDETEAHLRDQFRLSCRAKILSDSGEVVCHTMRRGEMQIERQSLHFTAINSSLKLEPNVVRKEGKVFIDGELIEEYTGPIYGIAMDLGTTTIVLRLINLETGELIADSSFENPQRFGGSDVMSRIHYDSENKGRLLQRTLIGYINHAIEEFPVDPNSIYEMVVVGNSTMRDIFFRLSVYTIGQNPYQSITELEMADGKRQTTSLKEKAKRLGIHINPKGNIYALPIISGHVGADTTACMLAVNLANEDRTIALMDIGTNTELIVGNKSRIFAASCPAGPAFEGGKISHGMPGLPGAIERVKIMDNGNIEIKVIGNLLAEGICGSGLVDLMSELIRSGRMNSLGRFEDEIEIILNDDAKSRVIFNESDVNELAQAKGANVAGLHIIFSNYGIRFDEIDVFYLAGGFGRHLDIESSKRIGLIPNIDNEKIVQIGNAAIEGACIALLSISRRNEMEDIVKTITHCKLETHPDFFDYFVEGCQFNPVETLSREA